MQLSSKTLGGGYLITPSMERFLSRIRNRVSYLSTEQTTSSRPRTQKHAEQKETRKKKGKKNEIRKVTSSECRLIFFKTWHEWRKGQWEKASSYTYHYVIVNEKKINCVTVTSAMENKMVETTYVKRSHGMCEMREGFEVAVWTQWKKM